MKTIAVVPGGVVQGKKSPLHLGLGQRLKAARMAAGVLPTRLSLEAGLARATTAQIENGRVARLDVLERLAYVVGVSTCFLAFGAEGLGPWREKTPRAERPAEGSWAPTGDSGLVLACASMGMRLLEARDERGLHLRALARLADLAPTSITNIENGRSTPSVATAEKLAKALGVSPCWLAYGEGAPAAAGGCR